MEVRVVQPFVAPFGILKNVLLRQACGGRKNLLASPQRGIWPAGRPDRDITQAASGGIEGRQRLLVVPG